MNETYIGVIDHGTTGTRFIVFDHGGRVVANAYERHEQIYPEPGWVEHDPVEIWDAVRRTVLQGLSTSALDPEQLEALGIANQRETTVVWDIETDKPVYNALVWQDRRTTDRVEELEEEEKVESIREKTGLEADSGVETTTLRVDGGAVKNDFLCQLQSDIVQTDVVRPVVDETTALGSAYAAGLAVGYWEELDELREHRQVDREFQPEMDSEDADKMYSRWTAALEKSRGWMAGSYALPTTSASVGPCPS